MNKLYVNKKVGDHSPGWPEGSLLKSYNTRCKAECYSFLWVVPLYPWYILYKFWVLSKEVSSTIFWVFGMTWPGIEAQSLRPLANTLLTKKAYLISMDGMTMVRRRDNISTVQRTETNWVHLYCSKNRDEIDHDGFSDSHMRPFCRHNK